MSTEHSVFRPREMQPEHVSVDVEILRRALAVAQDCLEWCEQLQAEHQAVCGTETRKNKTIALIYEHSRLDAVRLIEEIKACIGGSQA